MWLSLWVQSLPSGKPQNSGKFCLSTAGSGSGAKEAQLQVPEQFLQPSGVISMAEDTKFHPSCKAQLPWEWGENSEMLSPKLGLN